MVGVHEISKEVVSNHYQNISQRSLLSITLSYLRTDQVELSDYSLKGPLGLYGDESKKITHTNFIFQLGFQSEAQQWLSSRIMVQKPPLSPQVFRDWISERYSKETSTKTASRIMKKLGWTYGTRTKLAYIDGHERADVVDHRKKVTQIMEVK